MKLDSDILLYVNKMENLENQTWVVLDEIIECNSKFIYTITNNFHEAFGAAMLIIANHGCEFSNVISDDLYIDGDRYCITFEFRPNNDPDCPLTTVSILNYTPD